MKHFVSIIPAAGKATGLPGLRGSKEIIPVSPLRTEEPASDEARPACLHLMDALQLAGIDR